MLEKLAFDFYKKYCAKEYVIWSSSKVSDLGCRLALQGTTDLEKLVHFENHPDGGGLSSNVLTHDIKQVIEACYNETDIELEYCLLSEYNAMAKKLGYI